MKSLDQTLLEQLVGRRSLSDVDFVTDLGIDYSTFDRTISKLVDDGLVEVVSPSSASETVYQLSSSADAQNLRASTTRRHRRGLAVS
jgi:predicted transcriptional regulator